MQEVEVGKWLDKVRANHPLVHNITNTVVTNVVANALLSLGASPVMADAVEEVEDMAAMANAVALNIGTLNDGVIASMRLAGRAANRAGVPVIFDPVGVGATKYRERAAKTLMEDFKLTVLRGNAGEIGYLLGAGGTVRGVDGSSAGEQLPQAMKAYATKAECIVAATGSTDYVTDGEHVYALTNGHPWMSAITGSGCQLTGLIGAFCGAADGPVSRTDALHATIAAITCWNIAGECAAQTAGGPGTFQAHLLDEIHRLDAEQLTSLAKIRLLEV